MTYPTPAAPAVDLRAAGVEGWFLVLRQVADRRAELDALEQQAEQHIKDALGDNVDGVIDGAPVVRWLHTAAPRRFNKKRFTADHPDLAAKYIEVGEPGRRFELVKPPTSKGSA